MKVDQIWSDDIEVTHVTSGENIKCKVNHLSIMYTGVNRAACKPVHVLVQVKGVEESDVSPGFVLCCPTNPIKTGRVFDAQVRDTANTACTT